MPATPFSLGVPANENVRPSAVARNRYFCALTFCDGELLGFANALANRALFFHPFELPRPDAFDCGRFDFAIRFLRENYPSKVDPV
jgi:hypothetical protein